MPTVLISGITGFIAAHLALVFLKKGWRVRGTVRSLRKGEEFKSLPAFAAFSDNLEFVVVEDLEDGDWTEAVKGVDAVAHLASPFHLDGKDWVGDYKNPAVLGTTNILEAAAKVPSIKAVVVTSSMAAVQKPHLEATDMVGTIFNENDWNPVTDEECQTLKAEDPVAGVIWYCASKKFAELAAWEVGKKANFKLSTICPPMVFGPPVHINNVSTLNASTGSIYGLMKKDGSSVGQDISYDKFPHFADVRNVAQAHYEAIVKEKTGRFIVSSGIYNSQEVVDFIREKYPDIAARLPTGKPGNYLHGKVFEIDASKAHKELGIDYIPLESCISDTVDQLLLLEKHSASLC